MPSNKQVKASQSQPRNTQKLNGKTSSFDAQKSNDHNKNSPSNETYSGPRPTFTILTKNPQPKKPITSQKKEQPTKLNADFLISKKDEIKFNISKELPDSKHSKSQEFRTEQQKDNKKIETTKDAAPSVPIDSSKAGTKVVVRALPPNITEEEFLGSIEEYKSQINWHHFILGRLRTAQDKEVQHSICYVNFIDHEKAENFRKNYQGKTFTDQYHKMYRTMVVYAPFQKVPREQLMPDRRSNTIEKDPVYTKFIEKLSETRKKSDILTDENMDIPILHNDEGEVVTPLILAFNNRYGIQTQVSGKTYTPLDYEREFKTHSEEYTSTMPDKKLNVPIKSSKRKKKKKEPHLKNCTQHPSPPSDHDKRQSLDKIRKSESSSAEIKKGYNKRSDDNPESSLPVKPSRIIKKVTIHTNEDQ